MIRRPPRPPLFPSTTLFRSPRTTTSPYFPRVRLTKSTDCACSAALAGNSRKPSSPASRRFSSTACALRSEEHTSELQSQSNLVCRLLLEKQNNILLHDGSLV